MQQNENNKDSNSSNDDPSGNEQHQSDEELAEEILLKPLQTGKYTYDPKPPSAFWLEIEKTTH